jgi:hypothetical protein
MGERASVSLSGRGKGAAGRDGERMARASLADVRLVQLPKITDVRGNLTYVESNRHVPFAVQRAYWVYDVPGGEARRGGHAYFRLEEFIVALSGSFTVTVGDGRDERRFTLSRSYFGLYVPHSLWRHLHDFSTNSVCLVFASAPYDVDDYIRDREWFARWRGQGGS